MRLHMQVFLDLDGAYNPPLTHGVLVHLNAAGGIIGKEERMEQGYDESEMLVRAARRCSEACLTGRCEA